MPDLTTSLHGHDLGHLRLVAGLWGYTIDASDTRAALAQLVPLLTDLELIEEIIESIPAEARRALEALQQAGNRLPWLQFTRQFGEIREMGPGKRDRVRPDLNPVSPAEMLWYRALIARAFFDTPTGPLEFIYIPTDLAERLPKNIVFQNQLPGRAARPEERKTILKAKDLLLDDACTLLAWLRLGYTLQNVDELLPYLLMVERPDVIAHFLQAAGMIGADIILQAEPVKQFLEAGRGQALLTIARAWLESSQCNDLRLTPGLLAEGEWQNDPLRARQTVCDLLSNLPSGTWWSLPAFIASIKDKMPDFQRPAGDFDSWYLRDVESGDYLQGFEHWDQVEGKFLHYLLTGPLHWLGFLDLACPVDQTTVTAFRRSHWWTALMEGTVPQSLPAESDVVLAASDGKFRVPRLVPRTARYQISRFSEWIDAQPDGYRFQVTPSSLERARSQGLTVGQFLALARKYTHVLPPLLIKSLERWEARGTEARLQSVTILRVSSPDMLKMLRESRAARFLGDPLGPTTVIVHPNAGPRVLAVLAELGYLGEMELE